MRQCLSCRKRLDDAQYVCPSCGGRTHDPAETVDGQIPAPTTTTSGRRWAVKPAPPAPAIPAPVAGSGDALRGDPAGEGDGAAPLPLSVTGKKWRSRTEDGQPGSGPRPARDAQPGSGPRPARGAVPSGQDPGSGPRPTYDGGQPGSGPRPARDLQVDGGEKPGATSSGVFDDFQRSPAAPPPSAPDGSQGSGLFDDLYQGPPQGPGKSAALTTRSDSSSSNPRAPAVRPGASAPDAAADAEEFPAAPLKSGRARAQQARPRTGPPWLAIVAVSALVIGAGSWFAVGMGAAPAPAAVAAARGDLPAVGLPGLPAWAVNRSAGDAGADIVVHASEAQPETDGAPLQLVKGPGDALPRFSDAELGASYCPPAGWTVTTDRSGNRIACAQPHPLPRAQMDADRLADGETVAAYVQAWTAAMARDLAGFAPVGAAPFSTDGSADAAGSPAAGNAGMRVVFTDSEDGAPLRYTVVIVPGGPGRVLRLICCAGAADGDRHDADFLAMARSMRTDGVARTEARDAP